MGFGFSGSFVMALVFRFLGGILNGNVGVRKRKGNFLFMPPSKRLTLFAFLKMRI